MTVYIRLKSTHKVATIEHVTRSGYYPSPSGKRGTYSIEAIEDGTTVYYIYDREEVDFFTVTEA